MKNLIFFVVVFTIFASIACIKNKTPEEIEEAISRSDVLKRIDKLCIEMPKPANFRFVKKQFGGNAEIAALVFDYWSYKRPREIKEFYMNWAKENSWKTLEENRYVKGKQTVVIEFEVFRDSNVGITCKELR